MVGESTQAARQRAQSFGRGERRAPKAMHRCSFTRIQEVRERYARILASRAQKEK